MIFAFHQGLVKAQKRGVSLRLTCHMLKACGLNWFCRDEVLAVVLPSVARLLSVRHCRRPDSSLPRFPCWRQDRALADEREIRAINLEPLGGQARAELASARSGTALSKRPMLFKVPNARREIKNAFAGWALNNDNSLALRSRGGLIKVVIIRTAKRLAGTTL